MRNALRIIIALTAALLLSSCFLLLRNAAPDSVSQRGGSAPESTESAEPFGGGITPDGELLPPDPEPFGEPLPSEPIRGYDTAPNERVVTTHAELASALTEGNGVDHVYLGADIVMTGGIQISNTKAYLIIDGTNPYDDENPEERHTLTEFSSLSATGTFYVSTSGVRNVTLQNMNIIGKNYYGTVCAHEVTATDNLIITYRNITYAGPQIGHHRRGTVRFDNCDVTITGENGGSPEQEFSEVKHLIFEGDNKIFMPVATQSVFWIPYGGSLTIGDNASLALTCDDNSAFGAVYANGADNDVAVTIGENAVFDITLTNTFAPSDGVNISPLTVKHDGAFRLRTTDSYALFPVLAVGGDLYIGQNAEFAVIAHGGTANPALDVSDGDITVEEGATFRVKNEISSNMLIRLNGNALHCKGPQRMVLYNAGNRCLNAYLNDAQIDITASQVNYWDDPSPGGIEGTPLRRWIITDENVRLAGTLKRGADGNFASIETNYEPYELEPGDIALDATSFDMRYARVLSFGALDITVHTPRAGADTISGITEPGALVRVWLTSQGAERDLPDAIADGNGDFSVPTGDPLAPDTVIYAVAYKDYLYATTSAIAVETGTLEITIPHELRFCPTELGVAARTIERLDENWHINVWDTRDHSGAWQLFVSAPGPLSPETGGFPPLKDALIFVDSGGDTALLGAGETLIYAHDASDASEQVNIGWSKDRGILLHIEPFTAHSGVSYAATLFWTVTMAP